jgi:hypothetical protein
VDTALRWHNFLIFVVLDYVDHSDKDGDWVAEQMCQANVMSSGRTRAFPSKVHYMLESTSISADSTIISWLAHGRAFKVRRRFRVPLNFASLVQPSILALLNVSLRYTTDRDL